MLVLGAFLQCLDILFTSHKVCIIVNIVIVAMSLSAAPTPQPRWEWLLTWRGEVEVRLALYVGKEDFSAGEGYAYVAGGKIPVRWSNINAPVQGSIRIEAPRHCMPWLWFDPYKMESKVEIVNASRYSFVTVRRLR